MELVCPVEPHVASFDVRGSGEWNLTLFGPGLDQKIQSFSAGDSWQRIELPFSPQIRSRFCQLSFTGTGELYLDKLQVAPRSQYNRSYCAPMPCEAAMTLAGVYDAGAAKVVFDDERAVLEMDLRGECADCLDAGGHLIC